MNLSRAVAPLRPDSGIGPDDRRHTCAIVVREITHGCARGGFRPDATAANVTTALQAAGLVLPLAVGCAWGELWSGARAPQPRPEEVPVSDRRSKLNRLAAETSPYLLQHAGNPVDWQPWGEEAFARAREEDKPVFLSVGYSTCHWCHVMERESFEREDVARLLNDGFVAIKVDREERPDVDELYMLAAQLMTGRGGWPNSVWLTPDGRPWFAGSYFPREDAPGRAGFKTVLRRLTEAWRSRREEVEATAERIAQAVRQASAYPAGEPAGPLTRAVVAAAVEQLRGQFDEHFGGFGEAPKFPPHSALRLLSYELARSSPARTPEASPAAAGEASGGRGADLTSMISRTLEAMAQGGIHDHVGGGFHRYSTDRRWFLPHFEKMLYDNAQLARAYADGFTLTGSETCRRAAEGILQWLFREMTDPAGGFHSALDADSEGVEGKFYLWTIEEVRAALGADEAELFARVYNMEPGGNYHDEASGRRTGGNILHLGRPIEASAKVEGIPPKELRGRMDAARSKLLERQAGRVRPQRDDKVLTSWNGLMIGALAHAGQRLGRPDYVQGAERAAEFLLSRMRKEGRLLRTYRNGAARLEAYLDDYAFLAEGLLDLHETTGEPRWLEEARRLVAELDRRYRDPRGGYFFTAEDHEQLLARLKNPYDSSTPSGNGVTAAVLVRLARLTGQQAYLRAARSVLDAFADRIQQSPAAMATFTLAAAMYFDATAAGAGTDASAEPGHETATPPSAGEPVKVEATAARKQVAPGDEVDVELRITIAEGWHVNSSRPAQKYLTPTSVAIADGSLASLTRAEYPPGRRVRLGFGQEPLSLYEGPVIIPLRVRIARDAPPGPAEVRLEVRTQACDDRSCRAPQVHVLSVPLEVVPPSP